MFSHPLDRRLRSHIDFALLSRSGILYGKDVWHFKKTKTNKQMQWRSWKDCSSLCKIYMVLLKVTMVTVRGAICHLLCELLLDSKSEVKCTVLHWSPSSLKRFWFNLEFLQRSVLLLHFQCRMLQSHGHQSLSCMWWVCSYLFKWTNSSNSHFRSNHFWDESHVGLKWVSVQCGNASAAS